MGWIFCRILFADEIVIRPCGLRTATGAAPAYWLLVPAHEHPYLPLHVQSSLHVQSATRHRVAACGVAIFQIFLIGVEKLQYVWNNHQEEL